MSGWRQPDLEFRIKWTENAKDQQVKDLKELKRRLSHDVGTEKITEWGAEQIYAIINARYNDMLQTVITTNITTPDDLAAHIETMGERIISRLSQMCLWVRMEDSCQRQRPSPR